MKILLIEDEKEIVDFLKPSLESEGFVVDIAGDGEQGAFMGKINQYDLVIIDIMLPKKNGDEVCRELRERGQTMPILILSVIAETKNKAELLNAGADDYLTKPFSFEELLARVRALLRRPRDIQEEVFSIADLELDSVRHTVKRAGKRVHLTPKEFRLLEYLLQNMGAVVSRGMILEHVWDMNADPFSNTIEAHILSLRKKIDAKRRKKLIHTVHGMGYRIDTER